MGPRREESSAQLPRLPASDVIEAVVENMRRNLEPLKYSTLAPSRYVVYLHAAEYARLEGILPILKDQTIRALSEELAALNARPRLKEWVERVTGSKPAVENPATDWFVEFLRDPDDELSQGDILIDSELLLPARPDLGVGERTRRITTVHSGTHTTSRVETIGRSQASAAAVFARLVYDDDTGRHSYDMVKESLTIGRGSITFPVDLRVVSSTDVSREHARIRRDPATGLFYLTDLSTLGTTLHDRHVPRGYEEVDGTKRENGVETPLPDRARIGLADVVHLEFQKI